LDGVVDIETVKNHTCVRRDRAPTMMCWGSNRYLDNGRQSIVDHKLGPGAQGAHNSATPVPVELGSQVLDIGMGYETTFATTIDGKLFAWGCNERSAAGIEVPDFRVAREPMPVMAQTPRGVQPLEEVAAVLRSDGADQCLEMDNDARYGGHFLCWGANDNGELGYADASLKGTRFRYALPVKALPSSARKLVRGENFGCAVTHESDRYEVWCYGKQGMLGNGSIDDGSTQPDQAHGTPVEWIPENFGPFLR
jgi:alpha-tubulin suppressor-like RCC1 family protein